MSYKGDKILCISRIAFEIPILGYFGVWSYFWSIELAMVQSLTSYSCSATPISYECDKISRLSCLVIEIPILGYLGVFWVLSDPDIL